MGQQLKKEPDDDSEREAKFKLYESLLETVIVIRTEMEKVWNENKESLPKNTQRDFVTRLKKLDGGDKTGIYDDDFNSNSTWFVYNMAVQAKRNRDHITSLLKNIEIYLTLLEKECDCPMCLEPLKDLPEDFIVVLACCHKVCNQCWKEWSKVRGSKGVF